MIEGLGVPVVRSPLPPLSLDQLFADLRAETARVAAGQREHDIWWLMTAAEGVGGGSGGGGSGDRHAAGVGRGRTGLSDAEIDALLPNTQVCAQEQGEGELGGLSLLL